MNSRSRRQNTEGAAQKRGTSSYDEAKRARGQQGRAGRRGRSSSAPQGAGSGSGSGNGSRTRRVKEAGRAAFAGASSIMPKIVLVLFALVVLRLVWFQVIQTSNLSNTADSEHITSIELLAKRGTIYDRNGNVLATSVECQTIYCNPNAVKDKNHAATILADSLGGKQADYLKVLSQDTTFAYIQKRVDDDVADKIFEQLQGDDIDGIYSLEDVKRVYPYGSVGGQVLGFVGDDGDGLSGLELYYNDILKGANGEMIMERGLTGIPVAGGASEIHEAKDGTDIVISLDVNVQKVAEDNLVQGVADANAESGNVVVTDPKTGEILAACSLPLFDPTDTSTITDASLNLTSVTASYEPGSTFKPIMVAVGYDNGIFNRDTVYNIPAETQVGDDTVTDVDGRDYSMDMSPTEMLKRSSNVGAALFGQAIGADTFAAGIKKFGIGQKTGVDFPGESAGIVLDRSEYTGASLGSMSFGQSLSFPSIQLVRAIGAIANDGVILTPHFLVQKGGSNVDWGEGEQAVSAEAANMVTEDMKVVVNDDEGTGKNARIAGYLIAGKTGTGEMASESGGYKEDSFLSSFIGFANADDPDILVYVGIYGTAQHGSTAAAPVFSAIMSEALTDLAVQPVG